MNWYDRQIKKLNEQGLSGEAYATAQQQIQGRWDTKQQNMANFNKAAGPLSMVGSVAGQFSNLNGSLDESTAQTREGLRSAIGQMGPWGAAISAASGVVDTLTDSLGISIETVDKDAANRAGAGGAATVNNMLAAIPGMSFVGAFGGKTEESQKSQFIDGMSNSYGASVQDINAAQKMGGKNILFGKGKINSFIREQNRVNSLMTSIGMQSEMAKNNDAGQLYQVQNANKYAGYSPRLLMAKEGIKFQELDSARSILKNIKNKKTGVVINAINTALQTVNYPDSGANIASTSSLLAANMDDGKLQPEELSTHIKNQIYDSAQDPEGIVIKIVENIEANKDVLKQSFKKNGLDDAVLALNSPENADSLKTIYAALRHIINNRTYENGGELAKFQLGGKIDKNFIPQGALHKNKHHLEEVNPELEGSVTKKGIPVISIGEDGIQQHAEVEKNEIVFCLSTTNAVEELYKQYQVSEDENLLIECGKFLTEELLKNTEDPGKLRKTIG